MGTLLRFLKAYFLLECTIVVKVIRRFLTLEHPTQNEGIAIGQGHLPFRFF